MHGEPAALWGEYAMMVFGVTADDSGEEPMTGTGACGIDGDNIIVEGCACSPSSLFSIVDKALGFGPRFFLCALYSHGSFNARQFPHSGLSASHLTLRRLHSSHA